MTQWSETQHKDVLSQFSPLSSKVRNKKGFKNACINNNSTECFIIISFNFMATLIVYVVVLILIIIIMNFLSSSTVDDAT